ncbi:MAG: hypothetical protein IJ705_04810, partial [Oscillospiraceae bacterium]|nr:hypothetical protein [Oscillospiraceae bacterium]
MSDDINFFPLERNRYFYGKLLTVRDFEMEQRYGRRKSQLMNRLCLGAGVVCGLGVSASDDVTLLIESGMALDYRGRMVVVEEPLLRKLQMLEGQESIQGKDTAYLCLRYQETDLEPVNAVGADTGESRQFNMTREGSSLYLTAQAPEYRGLLEAGGADNVSILYAGDDLTLVLAVPSEVCAAQEFTVEVLVVKNKNTPPVHFRLEGENSFAESEDGRISLEFREAPEETRNVYTVPFRIRARQLSELEAPLFNGPAELRLELGS